MAAISTKKLEERLEIVEKLLFEAKIKLECVEKQCSEALSRAIDANIGIGAIRESTHKVEFLDPYELQKNRGEELPEMFAEDAPEVSSEDSGRPDLIVKEILTEEGMNKRFDEMMYNLDGEVGDYWGKAEPGEETKKPVDQVPSEENVDG